MLMPGSLDAGRHTLAGFLYQLTASVHDALKVLRAPNFDTNCCEAAFAIEQYGQDAALLQSDTMTRSVELIQFKHSSQPNEHPLHTSELIDILLAFRRSEGAAQDDNHNHLQFRLVTNRQLTRDAETMRQKAASGQPYDPLDKPREEKIRKKVMHKGRGPEINKDLRRILMCLKTELLDSERIRQGINQCASEFGLIGEELRSAVDRLIRFAMTKAASADNKFVRSDVLAELANFHNPRSLRDGAIHDLISRSLTDFQKAAGTGTGLVRRSVLDQVEKQLSHALIAIVGGRSPI